MRHTTWPALLAVILACGGSSWKSFVYPDGDDLTASRSIGEYSSLKDCREAAKVYVSSLADPPQADYECGRDCKRRGGLPIEVCDETVR